MTACVPNFEGYIHFNIVCCWARYKQTEVCRSMDTYFKSPVIPCNCEHLFLFIRYEGKPYSLTHDGQDLLSSSSLQVWMTVSYSVSLILTPMSIHTLLNYCNRPLSAGLSSPYWPKCIYRCRILLSGCLLHWHQAGVIPYMAFSFRHGWTKVWGFEGSPTGLWASIHFHFR